MRSGVLKAIARTVTALAMSAVLAMGMMAGILGAQAAVPDAAHLTSKAYAKPKPGAKGWYTKVFSYNKAAEIPNALEARVVSYKKKTLKIQIVHISSTLESSTKIIKVKIKNNKGSFTYRDSFEHKGKGAIKLGRGWIKIKLKVTSPMSRGALSTYGKWVKLKKD